MGSHSHCNLNNLTDQKSQDNATNDQTNVINDTAAEFEQFLTLSNEIPSSQNTCQLSENNWENFAQNGQSFTNPNTPFNNATPYIQPYQSIENAPLNHQSKGEYIQNDIYYPNMNNGYHNSINLNQHSIGLNYNQPLNNYSNFVHHQGQLIHQQNPQFLNQPFYNNTTDSNFYSSNFNYDYTNQFQSTIQRPFISPQNHSNHPNHSNHQNMHTRPPSNFNNNSFNIPTPIDNYSVTSEMINVVNSTTMTTFTSNQVCQQINSILESQPKNLQTIILAEREASWKESNSKNSVDDNDVGNLLKETGFIKNISKEFNIEELIQNPNKRTTNEKTRSCTEVDQVLNNGASTNDRTGMSNKEQSSRNGPDTVDLSALDLSISSDEDGRISKYGPIGSNANKTCMPDLAEVLLIKRQNNISSVRRMSQTANTCNNNYEKVEPEVMKHQATNEANSPKISPRARSLGSQPENLNISYDDIPEDERTTQVFKQMDEFMRPVSPFSINPNIVLNEALLTRMSSTIIAPIPTNIEMGNLENPFRPSYLDSRPAPHLPPMKLYTMNNNYHHSPPPPRNYHQGHEIVRKEGYSRKVFVGGLPQDITENQISAEFKRFGELQVDWPHKVENQLGLPPKGYAFLLFADSQSVLSLIRACQIMDDKYFWTVSSERLESKQVQIRPWTLTDTIWSLRNPPMKPSPRCKQTVFVGGIPRQAQAKELFDNMNRCFGGVSLVEIDVDIEYSYPKGAASVTFENISCYIKALETHFITLKLCGMEKRVEIKPFFSDDQHCEGCGISMNSRANSTNPSCSQPIGQCFCVARGCLKYFCDQCWVKHQSQSGHNESHHSNKSGTGVHRQFIFKRGVYPGHHSHRPNTN